MPAATPGLWFFLGAVCVGAVVVLVAVVVIFTTFVPWRTRAGRWDSDQ
jgi:hypothetical protein